MKIRILGCGPSFGIPSIRKQFEACDETLKENMRTRSSVLVQIDKTNILIDSGPDLRYQIMKAGYPRVHAVLYTHAHYDHMGGANDLNGYFTEEHKTIPVFAVEKDMERLSEIVPYMMKEWGEEYYLERNVITPYQKFFVHGIDVLPLLQIHGPGHSIGYRIGDFAYTTDVNKMDDKNFDLLKGIKLWVLGVGVKEDKPKCPHLSLPEAINWIERVKPQRAILTHMGGRLDFKTLSNILPTYIRPAYDGLEVEI